MEYNKVEILSLTKQLFRSYVEVGTRAYNQHYLHLWKNNDSTPYINSSFTEDVLQKEIQNSNTELFLIKNESTPVGILKLDLNTSLDSYSKKEGLLLDKIYLLKEHSGKGIGRMVLEFTEARARQLGKKIIWLDTMKNGPALQFYLKNGFENYGETELQFAESLKAERPMYVMIKKLLK